MKSKEIFALGFNRTTQPTIGDPLKPTFRPTQAAAFHALKDQQHVILNAPTGWGKTIVMAVLIMYKLLRNPKLRCVIAVPQTVIGKGFIRDWRLKVPGHRKLVDWLVQHDLCGKHPQKVSELISFLSSRASCGRVLLCTHDTLADAYQQLTQARKLATLSNLLVWVDEAHHVMNAQAGSDTVSNALGELVRRLAASKTAHVGLATATFMRGDRRHILPDRLAERFTRYGIPYDVYFADRAPVESFTFNVMCGNYLDGIERLFRKKCPTIIYLAKRKSRHASDCKYTEVKQIVRRLAKACKVKPRREKGMILLGDLKVLDLVTEAGREQRKERLDEADVIIALDMCREGFDWPKAARSIIVGERHSVPEMIQTIGRLFRESPGKKLAEVYQILPSAVRNTSEFQDARNDILTVIFSAMLLEDVFAPVPMSGQRGPQLASVVTNTDAWQKLVRDYHATLSDAAKNGKITWTAALPHRTSLLNKHGIPEKQHKQVWEKLWATFARLTRRAKGLNVKDVPFRLLKHVDISEGLLKLSSGLCGKTTFAELRAVLSEATKTPEQWVPIADVLAANYAAQNRYRTPTLPCHSWLRHNKFSGLSEAIRKYPSLFSHLRQESKKGTTLIDHIALATRLVRYYGGRLPALPVLKADGHTALVKAIHHNSSAFSHIPREHTFKTPDDHADVANQLALANNGILPSPKQLERLGHTALLSAMQNHPEHFQNIKQARNRVRRTSAELRKLALKLASMNGGILPPSQYLKARGYWTLETALRKQPELFRGIPQSRLKLQAANRVTEAESLAAKNGGVLQNVKWLEDNGYHGIVNAMRKHRRLFAHIKQQKFSRQGVPITAAA